MQVKHDVNMMRVFVKDDMHRNNDTIAIYKIYVT